MRSPQRPLHLLLLYEPAADDLVDGRFHERRADRFSLPIPLTVVGDRFLVMADIGSRATVDQRLSVSQPIRRRLGATGN